MNIASVHDLARYKSTIGVHTVKFECPKGDCVPVEFSLASCFRFPEPESIKNVGWGFSRLTQLQFKQFKAKKCLGNHSRWGAFKLLSVPPLKQPLRVSS